MTSSGGPDSAESLLLSIRCTGLTISTKKFLNSKSSGMMTRMLTGITGAPTPKHEKRIVKLSQSAPFQPTAGRPPTFNFDQIYSSEVMEGDSSGGAGVFNPALLAEIHCPRDLDCRLRINVYYSSSLTSSKEILLASTSFSKRELLRASGVHLAPSSSSSSNPQQQQQQQQQSSEALSSFSSTISVSSDALDSREGFCRGSTGWDLTGALVSEMNSEFCPGSKAYIEIIPPIQWQWRSTPRWVTPLSFFHQPLLPARKAPSTSPSSASSSLSVVTTFRITAPPRFLCESSAGSFSVTDFTAGSTYDVSCNGSVGSRLNPYSPLNDLVRSVAVAAASSCSCSSSDIRRAVSTGGGLLGQLKPANVLIPGSSSSSAVGGVGGAQTSSVASSIGQRTTSSSSSSGSYSNATSTGGFSVSFGSMSSRGSNSSSRLRKDVQGFGGEIGGGGGSVGAGYHSVDGSAAAGSLTSPAEEVQILRALNPLQQNYVFYDTIDNLTPTVDVQESSWEPRFAGAVSVLFLESFTASLVRSINAWNLRYELERMRQGLFHTEEEALRSGWHVLKVRVIAARVGASKAKSDRAVLVARQQQMQRQLSQQQQQQQTIAHRSGGAGSASVGGGVIAGGQKRVTVGGYVVNNNNKNNSSNNGSSSSSGGAASFNVYQVCIPAGYNGNITNNNSNNKKADKHSNTIAAQTNNSSSNRSIAVDVRQDGDSVLVGGAQRSTSEGEEEEEMGVVVQPWLGAAGGGRVDDSAPSTYVEVTLEDSEQLFVETIGRTNTEYYTMNPVYGSNLNDSYAKKTQSSPTTSDPSVQLVSHPRDYLFDAYIATDRDSVSYFPHLLSRPSYSSNTTSLEREENRCRIDSKNNNSSNNNNINNNNIEWLQVEKKHQQQQAGVPGPRSSSAVAPSSDATGLSQGSSSSSSSGTNMDSGGSHNVQGSRFVSMDSYVNQNCNSNSSSRSASGNSTSGVSGMGLGVGVAAGPPTLSKTPLFEGPYKYLQRGTENYICKYIPRTSSSLPSYSTSHSPFVGDKTSAKGAQNSGSAVYKPPTGSAGYPGTAATEEFFVGKSSSYSDKSTAQVNSDIGNSRATTADGGGGGGGGSVGGSVSLKFSFCVEVPFGDGGPAATVGKRRIGTAKMPVYAGMSAQNVWLPVQLSALSSSTTERYLDDIFVQVSVEVVSPAEAQRAAVQKESSSTNLAIVHEQQQQQHRGGFPSSSANNSDTAAVAITATAAASSPNPPVPMAASIHKHPITPSDSADSMVSPPRPPLSQSQPSASLSQGMSAGSALATKTAAAATEEESTEASMGGTITGREDSLEDFDLENREADLSAADLNFLRTSTPPPHSLLLASREVATPLTASENNNNSDKNNNNPGNSNTDNTENNKDIIYDNNRSNTDNIDAAAASAAPSDFESKSESKAEEKFVASFESDAGNTVAIGDLPIDFKLATSGCSGALPGRESQTEREGAEDTAVGVDEGPNAATALRKEKETENTNYNLNNINNDNNHNTTTNIHNNNYVNRSNVNSDTISGGNSSTSDTQRVRNRVRTKSVHARNTQAPASMPDTYLYERTPTGVPLPHATVSSLDGTHTELLSTGVLFLTNGALYGKPPSTAATSADSNTTGAAAATGAIGSASGGTQSDEMNRKSTSLASSLPASVPRISTSELLQSLDNASYSLRKHYDYRAAIANSYSWMWHLGYNGLDPLIIPPPFPVPATARGPAFAAGNNALPVLFTPVNSRNPAFVAASHLESSPDGAAAPAGVRSGTGIRNDQRTTTTETAAGIGTAVSGAQGMSGGRRRLSTANTINIAQLLKPDNPPSPPAAAPTHPSGTTSAANPPTLPATAISSALTNDKVEGKRSVVEGVVIDRTDMDGSWQGEEARDRLGEGEKESHRRENEKEGEEEWEGGDQSPEVRDSLFGENDRHLLESLGHYLRTSESRSSFLCSPSAAAPATPPTAPAAAAAAVVDDSPRLRDRDTETIETEPVQEEPQHLQREGDHKPDRPDISPQALAKAAREDAADAVAGTVIDRDALSASDSAPTNIITSSGPTSVQTAPSLSTTLSDAPVQHQRQQQQQQQQQQQDVETALQGDASLFGYEVQSRVDCWYPLDWIRTHILRLEALVIELRTLLPDLRTIVKNGLEDDEYASYSTRYGSVGAAHFSTHYSASTSSHSELKSNEFGRILVEKEDMVRTRDVRVGVKTDKNIAISSSVGGFRSSSLKKQFEYQGLAINMHYQIMAVRRHVDPRPYRGGLMSDSSRVSLSSSSMHHGNTSSSTLTSTSSAAPSHTDAARKEGDVEIVKKAPSPRFQPEPRRILPETDVIHSMTCGSFSPHMLGYKQGGLFAQEAVLLADKEELESLKNSFLRRVKPVRDTRMRSNSYTNMHQDSEDSPHFGPPLPSSSALSISTTSSAGLSCSSTNNGYSPSSSAQYQRTATGMLSRLDTASYLGNVSWTLLSEVQKKALKYEASIASVCHRRVYAVSQALSVAVNAFLLKVSILLQQQEEMRRVTAAAAPAAATTKTSTTAATTKTLSAPTRAPNTQSAQQGGNTDDDDSGGYNNNDFGAEESNRVNQNSESEGEGEEGAGEGADASSTASAAIVDGWLKDGFVVVFEGLLSVVGNERAMLEDTISAVDALKCFQIRLLSKDKYHVSGIHPPSSSTSHSRSPSPPANAAASPSELQPSNFTIAAVGLKDHLHYSGSAGSKVELTTSSGHDDSDDADRMNASKKSEIRRMGHEVSASRENQIFGTNSTQKIPISTPAAAMDITTDANAAASAAASAATANAGYVAITSTAEVNGGKQQPLSAEPLASQTLPDVGTKTSVFDAHVDSAGRKAGGEREKEKEKKNTENMNEKEIEMQQIEVDGVHLEVRGREVVVYLAEEVLRRMSKTCFHRATNAGSTGFIIPFVPLLFTQGIDIQQTMATTFTGSSTSSSNSSDSSNHSNSKNSGSSSGSASGGGAVNSRGRRTSSMAGENKNTNNNMNNNSSSSSGSSGGGSTSAGATALDKLKPAELQFYINMKALAMLNRYCYKNKPINSFSTSSASSSSSSHRTVRTETGSALTDNANGGGRGGDPSRSHSRDIATNAPTAAVVAGTRNASLSRYTEKHASTVSSSIPPPRVSSVDRCGGQVGGDNSGRNLSGIAGFGTAESGRCNSTSRRTSVAPSLTSSSSSSHELDRDNIHPLLMQLHEHITSARLTAKNVSLLSELERVCILLEGACRVTFCKSGKDRTGMAVTLEQSRQLGERFGCGMATDRELRDANLFRAHGTRLDIAEKNIGRRVFSINILQSQFLPAMYRPPAQVCEDLMKKDTS